ncbi:hypothetical protein NQ317_006831, partial [Molorchus minor]
MPAVPTAATSRKTELELENRELRKHSVTPLLNLDLEPFAGDVICRCRAAVPRLRRVPLTVECVCVVYSYTSEINFFLAKEENSLPLLVWWTPFMPNGYRTISCSNGLYECIVTKNRSWHQTDVAAYLFYASHIQNNDFPLPRNKNILWAVFHEESPKNYAPFLFDETQRLFNITSTFSRYSDVPVTLQYLPNIGLIKDMKYYVPTTIKNQYLNKLSPVLYIQSDCDTPIGRDYLVRELGKFVSIDSYGKCLRNKTFPKSLLNLDPLDLYNEKLLNFTSRYKFIIAFENAICDDYVTEKLWRPLIVGSIPIYLGSPNIQDWLPNNNSAILVQNFNDLQEVGDMIKKITSNNTLYEGFLEHKLIQISSMIIRFLFLNVLFVKNFIKKNVDADINKKKQSIYNCPKPDKSQKGNTWYQQWDIGKCQALALKILINKNKPYTLKHFDDTWKALLHNKT